MLKVITTVVLAPGSKVDDPKAFEIEGGARTVTSAAVALAGFKVTDFVPVEVVRSSPVREEHL